MGLFDVFLGSEKDAPLTRTRILQLVSLASEDVVDHARAGGEIETMQAIRQYRTETGASLKEALAVVKVLSNQPN
ncbi:MAG: hypothetical protein AAF564_20130 [Bacteroidota bacterium]